VYDEAFLAFKHCTLLGYELPQNLISFESSAFVSLSRHLDAKVEALNHSASQSFRPYASRAFIEGLALVRSVQTNFLFAEAFELIRLLAK
jgi:hypothetical protein